MTPKLLQGLYVITDSNLLPNQALLHSVELAIQGGARIVQYRDKSRDANRRFQEVVDLLRLCRTYGVSLIVNDDVELTAITGADGVHLGKDDSSATRARQRLGNSAIIGISCYNDLHTARVAENEGVNYVAFGSFSPSPTKPHAVRASLSLLVQARSQISIPICAIGGITTENAQSLIAAGADMLAVITHVFGHDDPKGAAQSLARLFSQDQLSLSTRPAIHKEQQ
jgi:thiamine-phosphate pyrophosphorylase